MLDRLPLELLDEVLDQLPPPNPDDSPRKRTDTLLACCVVSNRVHSRAVCLLWRDICIGVGEEIPAIVEWVEEGAAASLKTLVRSVEVDGIYGHAEMAWTRTLDVVQQFPSISRLQLDGGGDGIDLDILATSLPLLTTLHLSRVVLSPFSADTIFPNLLCLTLHRPRSTPTPIRSLPTAKHCPRFRALVVNPAEEGSDDVLFTSFDHDLAQQLDMLQIHGEYCQDHPILQSPVKVLVTVDEEDLGRNLVFNVKPRHLRIWTDDEYLSPLQLRVLSDLLDTSSRSLHFPSTHNPTYLPRIDELVRPTVDLLSRCSSLSVGVLWYDPSEEGNYTLSTSFWRYAKRLKAEQLAAEA